MSRTLSHILICYKFELVGPELPAPALNSAPRNITRDLLPERIETHGEAVGLHDHVIVQGREGTAGVQQAAVVFAQLGKVLTCEF